MSKRRKLQQTPDLAIYSNDGVVDNLLSTDASKALSANQGSVIQAALDLKAPLASPTLTGVPAAPTAISGTNTTQIATTAFVQTAVAGIVDTAPETLDTLNELAAALGDDPNFATTVSTQIGTKLDTSTWTNSAASAITSTQVSNWDTAYGWGDHGLAGYASASTAVTTDTAQTISGAKSFTSDLTLGFGGSYEDLILKTDTIASGYNGTFSIIPRTVPGSGTASQLTYFKNNISGAGTTRHDVSIDGNVGIGTSSPTSSLHVNHPNADVEVKLTSSAGAYSSKLTLGSAGAGGSAINATGATSSILFFQIDNSSRMMINSSGNVGIGTSSPSQRLSVEGGSIKLNNNNAVGAYYLWLNKKEGYDGGILLQRDNTLDWQIVNHTAGNLGFYSYGASSYVFNIERATGNVGIGTTSPSARLNIAGGENVLVLTDGRTATSGLFEHGIGFAHFYGVDGGIYVGHNDYFGGGVQYMKFNINATEQVRITAASNLLVGTTNAYLGGSSFFKQGGNAQPALSLFKNSSSSSSDPAFCVLNGLNGGTVSFQVLASGNAQNTNNSYGAISDAKLKENIEPASPKLDKLMQVDIVNYNLIGSELKQIGVVAQQLEEVFPSMIDELDDYEEVESTIIDDEGNETTEKTQVATGTKTKSVKYSVFVPILIKAMQEQQEVIKAQGDLIAALEQRITALEENNS